MEDTKTLLLLLANIIEKELPPIRQRFPNWKPNELDIRVEAMVYI